jgi:hypothetical protein
MKLSKSEAIALLAACAPPAGKLAALGVNIELTQEDRAALAGFNQVWLYEDGWWLDDPDIHRQAGLSQSVIGALSFMAAMQTTKNIRQHESGEHID